MKKTFKLDEVDCANCAAKMENQIRKIDGVTYAAISFMAQKLVIEADDSIFDEVVKRAAAVCKKIDSDCKVVIE